MRAPTRIKLPPQSRGRSIVLSKGLPKSPDKTPRTVRKAKAAKASRKAEAWNRLLERVKKEM